MKRLSLIALALAAMSVAACDPVADMYADSHLKSPTNTIVVPAEGFVAKNGRRTYNHPDERPPADARRVSMTTDGKPGYVVCQHYLTGAAGKMDWVLYDDAEIKGVNVRPEYAKAVCMEEGYRIKDGHAPQDLHPTTIYVSNAPTETLGAAKP